MLYFASEIVTTIRHHIETLQLHRRPLLRRRDPQFLCLQGPANLNAGCLFRAVDFSAYQAANFIYLFNHFIIFFDNPNPEKLPRERELVLYLVAECPVSNPSHATRPELIIAQIRQAPSSTCPTTILTPQYHEHSFSVSGQEKKG